MFAPCRQELDRRDRDLAETARHFATTGNVHRGGGLLVYLLPRLAGRAGVGVIYAVHDTAGADPSRKPVPESGIAFNGNILDRAATAAQIPDLNASVPARGGENATAASSRLETDLFQRRGVVTEDGHRRLGHHVYYFPCLVAGCGGQEVVILGKGEVYYGITVDLEREVYLVEGLVRVKEPYMPFFISHCCQAIT